MTKSQRVRRMRGENSKYFRGEIMTCFMCGKQEKSNLHYSSQWTVIEADGTPYYICNVCIPSKDDTASAADFKEAYARVLAKIYGVKRIP
jgi:hypothetical protein